MKTFRKLFKYFIAIILSICCVCGVGALGIIASGEIISTPTPAAALLPEINFSTAIALTASAAQTQTSVAMPPAPLASATLAPLIEIPVTPTIFIFDLQTSVAQPTIYVYSTNTPFTLSTQIPPISGGICACNGGLDCKDFSTHNQAQACYDHCVSAGYGDVHGLDGNDQDGLACESLP